MTISNRRSPLEELIKAVVEAFSGFDSQLEIHCMDLVVAGKYDTAIRESMLVVETRMRTLSRSTKWGVDLVNDCFGQKSFFGSKISDESKRQGFRDLFAGVMSIIRNDYAHNFKSPNQQEALRAIGLANMLLEKLTSLQ